MEKVPCECHERFHILALTGLLFLIPAEAWKKRKNRDGSLHSQLMYVLVTAIAASSVLYHSTHNEALRTIDKFLVRLVIVSSLPFVRYDTMIGLAIVLMIHIHPSCYVQPTQTSLSNMVWNSRGPLHLRYHLLMHTAGICTLTLGAKVF